MAAGKVILKRRAQAALLWALGLFLAVQLAAGYVLDEWGLAVRFPTAARHLAYLQSRPRQPDIVCLGSSRFGLGLSAPTMQQVLCTELNGETTPEVFNAAIEAGDCISADYMMTRLLQQGVRPRLAVIEVCPDALHRRNLWMYYHVRRQLGWHDVPSFVVDVVRARQSHRLLITRLVPLYAHRLRLGEELAAWWRGHPTIVNHYGFTGADQEWSQVLGVPQTFERVHRRDWSEAGVAGPRRWLKPYVIGGQSPAALDHLLATCQAHGIKVILVGVPVTAMHREIYTPEVEQAFLGYIATMQQRHGGQFVDLRSGVPDQLFWDNHHLLPEGCQFFSKKLASEVVAPAWRSLVREAAE